MRVVELAVASVVALGAALFSVWLWRLGTEDPKPAMRWVEPDDPWEMLFPEGGGWRWEPEG